MNYSIHKQSPTMEEICKSEERDLMVTCEPEAAEALAVVRGGASFSGRRFEAESMIASSCHSQSNNSSFSASSLLDSSSNRVPSFENTAPSSDIEHKMHIITQGMKSLASELTGVQNTTSSASNATELTTGVHNTTSSSPNATELTGVQNRASTAATYAEKRAKWRRKIIQRTKDLESEERANPRFKMMILTRRIRDLSRRQRSVTRCISRILDTPVLQKIHQKQRDFVHSMVRRRERQREIEMLSLNERMGLAEQKIQAFEKKLSDDITTLHDQFAIARTGVDTRIDSKYQENNKILEAVVSDQDEEIGWLSIEVHTLSEEVNKTKEGENKRRLSESSSSSKRSRLPSPMEQG